MDSTSVENPIPTDFLRQRVLVYHGASAQFGIEKDGFIPGMRPYSMKDVNDVTDVYKKIRWHGISDGYSILERCTKNSSDKERGYNQTSFSISYGKARSYMMRPCGETVDGIIHAIDDLRVLCEFVGDGEPLCGCTLNQINQRRILEFAEKMVDREYLIDSTQSLTKIYSKYSEMQKLSMAV
jgi:hypothetical protein